MQTSANWGWVLRMRRRVFALTAAILFVLSWIFPVGAGLVRNPTGLPQWWGTVDVALAFVVAVAALGIQGLAHGNVDKQAEQTNVSDLSEFDARDTCRGRSGYGGRRSDQLGELRDGFSLAHMAGMISSDICLKLCGGR